MVLWKSFLDCAVEQVMNSWFVNITAVRAILQSDGDMTKHDDAALTKLVALMKIDAVEVVMSQDPDILNKFKVFQAKLVEPVTQIAHKGIQAPMAQVTACMDRIVPSLKAACFL